MGISLYVEVMDHAPKDLTSGEKLVLLVIAERGRDDTRIATQSTRWTIETVMHRANMGEDGLKTAFKGLARKGCEVRKPLKYGPTGKPTFAYKGVSMSFQMPVFRDGVVIENLNYPEGHPQRGCHSTPSAKTEGVSQHPLLGVTAPPLGPQRGCHSTPQSLKELPSIPSSLSARVDEPVGVVVADLEEARERRSKKLQINPPTPARLVSRYLNPGENAEEITKEIVRRYPGIVKSELALFRVLDRDGQLAAKVAEVREAAEAEALKWEAAEASRQQREAQERRRQEAEAVEVAAAREADPRSAKEIMEETKAKLAASAREREEREEAERQRLEALRAEYDSKTFWAQRDPELARDLAATSTPPQAS